MKRRVFVSCLFIALAGLCSAANTAWNRPAASGPGNWNDAGNWSLGVPNALTVYTYTGNTDGLAEIQVTDAQTYGERLYHASGAEAPLLRVMSGGHLTYGTNAENDDHLFIGFTGNGNMTIEAGGLVTPKAKLYCAYSSGSTGTVDVAGMLDFTTGTHGMLVLTNSDTGYGTCNVLDGGVVKVITFNDTFCGIDQPVKAGGLLNIEGTGKVVAPGNSLIAAQALIAAGRVAGNGVIGNVVANYDFDLDETTITFFPFDVLSVDLGGDRNYTRGAVSLNLKAAVVDDGVPATAVLTWSQTAGPGTATFASPNSATTDVDFDAIGVYTLRLTADNTAGGGSEIVYDELDVTVTNPDCQDVVNANLLLAADVNGDCHVNLADIAEIAAVWMNCSNPQDTGCNWAYPVLTLVHEGHPTAVIVIGQGADTTEHYAAEELRLYLEKISGATIPIMTEGTAGIEGAAIYIGTPDTCQYIANSGVIAASSLGRDGLRIKTVAVDNAIILAGENPPGALYATYAFLEDHLGCRWYFPGSQGEYVPAMTTIATDQIDDTQKPAVQFRGLHPVAANTSDPEIATWMGRNRMNNISDVAYYWHEMPTVAEHVKKGIIYNTGTHFHHWLGGDDLFDTHPEYFPLIDGVRVPGFPSGYDPSVLQQHNYCLSNLDLVTEVANAIKDYVAQYPDVEIIGVHQQDSPVWCECGPCSAMGSGSPTDRLHIFLNRLVAELEATSSVLDHRLLATQAYQMTSELPVNVTPNPKVLIYYCLISHCARHGWNENCPTQDYQKNMLAGWMEHGNKLIAYTYHAECVTGFPMPMAYHSSNAMKYYNEIGVSGWYPEIAGDDPGQDPLDRDPNLLWGDEWYSKKETYYTAAKTLWDPSVTLDEIKDDFFPKFYGAAGPAMRNYYDTLEDAWHYPGDVLYPHKRVYGYNPSTCIDFLNPTLIDTLNGYLADAVALSVNESDVVQGRVARDVEMFAKWEQRYDETGGVATEN